ncbi:MAG: AAA family ATPase [Candidatus Pacebacteria bacterium]|nr:AAA family ATPase [Candidatus Paceibacterota bacterium]
MKKLNKPSISVESIPEELKACNQWVMYRLMKKPGKVKPDRVPMRANFSNASVTNPKTWCSFDDAVSALKKKNFNGIGFVFTGEDPYCGIDMDSCVNPKTNIIESWAKDWIDKFASYTELSPSGTGVHIIVKGKLLSEKGKKKEDYEIYDRKRFFTFTGNIISPEYSHIEERQEVAEEFYNFITDKQAIKTEIPLPEGQVLSSREIEDVIKKAKSAKNGEKFSKLFDGAWEEFVYPSQSEADQALCDLLAYWTDCNPIGIDQLFCKSKLYRDKWDRDDYRDSTIGNAISITRQQTKDDTCSKEEDVTEGFHIIHISDVKHQPMEYQIDRIWPINSVGIMSGQPGAHKSWLAWEIAVCISSGTMLFGIYECRKGRVLAFNDEDNLSMVTCSRIKALALQKNLDIKYLDLDLINVPAITLNDDVVQKKLELTIKQYKPDMVIFDPLRNVHSLDEDNATAMSAKLLHFLREMNRRYSCSVLLVCHDKKSRRDGGSNRPDQVRGSNALVGWRDNAIFLNEEKNKLIKVQIYNRACQSIHPFSFILKTEKDDQGDLKTAQLVVTTHDQIKDQKETKELQKIKKVIRENCPVKRNDIVDKVGINRKKCLTLINTLLNSDAEVSLSPEGLIVING